MSLPTCIWLKNIFININFCLSKQENMFWNIMHRPGPTSMYHIDLCLLEQGMFVNVFTDTCLNRKTFTCAFIYLEICLWTYSLVCWVNINVFLYGEYTTHACWLKINIFTAVTTIFYIFDFHMNYSHLYFVVQQMIANMIDCVRILTVNRPVFLHQQT